jgi:CubicO group peptidase (beta-lactamase class C family)
LREHELHDFGTSITIRNLLHHTSGLRDQWDLLELAGYRAASATSSSARAPTLSEQGLCR